MAAITDLVNTVDPQEALTQQVAKVEDVSDVSSCSCAIYLRIEASGRICRLLEKRVDLQPRNIPISFEHPGYREFMVGIVVSAIAVFRLVDNMLSSSLHC